MSFIALDVTDFLWVGEIGSKGRWGAVGVQLVAVNETRYSLINV